MIALPIGSLVVSHDEDIAITLSEVAALMEAYLSGAYVPPVEVIRLPGGFWHIHNGRRRYVAHIVLGLKFVTCVEVDSTGEPV